ncbi:MAG: selenite/tellurite reduction operon rhodanese-like protein ExtH, partial [Desulfuromusa sp.]|nr:selenite/tellurite reduction operon rhodanese-like protein ExtH [Desulfuromusa sp.]
TDPSVPSSITFLQLAVGDVPQPTPFTGSNPVNDLDTVQSQIEAADEAAALAGVSPFTDPDTTSTPTALIDADTLMAWEDLVNAPLDGNERVVIVDITSEAGYAAGHIPGAVYWSSGDRAENRFEGPIDGYNMVLGAEKFQSLLDVAGIDENTTIVLTTSSSVSYYPSRLYFTLRYWGVPKNRLKVLNGHNAAWPAAMLTTDVPTIADAGSLTVAELMTNTQVRASLSEMMDAARDRRGTPVDFRGDSTAAGSTGGAVFNGNINNGRYMDRYPYFDDEGLWLSRGEMISLMAEYDIVVSDFSTDESFSYPALPYCTKGNLGAYGYFLYDAILNVDTMLYDGSWSQWGALSDNVDNGGELSASENSGGYALEAWAVDNATYMEEVNYGLDALGDLDAFDTDPTALTLDPADTAANQIENIDFDYQIQAPTSPDSETAPPTEGDGDLGGGC